MDSIEAECRRIGITNALWTSAEETGRAPDSRAAWGGRKMQKQNPVMTNLSQPLLCRLIEGQATEHPNALAVSSTDGELTFKELNDRANQLSHRLRALGVGPDVPAALFIQSSPEMIIGALGILKAGGAYLPLNPETPAARTSLILRDSKASVVVTDSRESDRVPQG